jgi:hypothetical protein
LAGVFDGFLIKIKIVEKYSLNTAFGDGFWSYRCFQTNPECRLIQRDEDRSSVQTLLKQELL